MFHRRTHFSLGYLKTKKKRCPTFWSLLLLLTHVSEQVPTPWSYRKTFTPFVLLTHFLPPYWSCSGTTALILLPWKAKNLCQQLQQKPELFQIWSVGLWRIRFLCCPLSCEVCPPNGSSQHKKRMHFSQYCLYFKSHLYLLFYERVYCSPAHPSFVKNQLNSSRLSNLTSCKISAFQM